MAGFLNGLEMNKGMRPDGDRRARLLARLSMCNLPTRNLMHDS
jgi:hypothetical protein